MKKIILAMILAHAALAQTQPFRTLMTDTNGALATPTNFFRANSNRIYQAIGSVIANSSNSIANNNGIGTNISLLGITIVGTQYVGSIVITNNPFMLGMSGNATNPTLFGSVLVNSGITVNSNVSAGGIFSGDGSGLSNLTASADYDIPSSNEVSQIVSPGNDPVVNGLNLIAAYAAVKSFTPHGFSLSVTNRASVILFPGKYIVTSNAFQMDTDFVDLIGFGYRDDVRIESDGKTIVQTANDVRLKNFTCLTTIAKDSNIDTRTNDMPAGYFPASNLPATVIEDVVFDHANASNGQGQAMRIQIEYSGTYRRVKGVGGFCFGGHSTSPLDFSTASGRFEDCDGTGDTDFGGGGAAVASGIFIRCHSSGSSSCFGDIATGEFVECSAGNNSFGTSLSSGRFVRCKSGEQSFGFMDDGSGVASGYFEFCISGANSFAGGSPGNFTNTMSGTMVGCYVSSDPTAANPTNDLGLTGNIVGTLRDMQVAEITAIDPLATLQNVRIGANTLFNGNVGIGTTTPAAGLEIVTGHTNPVSVTYGTNRLMDLGFHATLTGGLEALRVYHGGTNPVSNYLWIMDIGDDSATLPADLAAITVGLARRGYAGAFVGNLLWNQENKWWAVQDTNRVATMVEVGQEGVSLHTSPIGSTNWAWNPAGNQNIARLMPNGNFGLGSDAVVALTTARLQVLADNSVVGLLNIGTTNKPGILYANTNGNVGIGTVTPNVIGYSANNVVVDVRASTVGRLGVLQLGTVGSVDGLQTMGAVNFYSMNGGSTVVGRSIISSALDGATNSTSIGFWTMDSGTLAEQCRLDRYGNFGIGTIAPAGKLEVSGNPTGLAFAVNTNQLVVTNGNVGIGTTTPSYPLTVSTPAGSYNGAQFRLESAAEPTTFNLNLSSYQPAGGVISYRFDLTNGATGFPNNMVLDRGNVGIGAASPTSGRLVVDGGHLTFGTDNTWGIGAVGANRPAFIEVGGYGRFGGVVTNNMGSANFRSNALPPIAITVGASPFNWTNSQDCNVHVFVDGVSVTGTTAINGGVVYNTIGQNLLPLGPGEWATIAYTLGTPTATWRPSR